MTIVFILVYLAGLIALLGWIVVGWTKYESNHKVPEVVRNILGFVLFLVIFFGGYWVMNSAKNETIENYKSSQHQD